MKEVNIKNEVKDLPSTYATEVKRFEDPFHKHIFIPLLGKTYIKDKYHNWYEGNCKFCSSRWYKIKRFLKRLF